MPLSSFVSVSLVILMAAQPSMANFTDLDRARMLERFSLDPYRMGMTQPQLEAGCARVLASWQVEGNLLVCHSRNMPQGEALRYEFELCEVRACVIRVVYNGPAARSRFDRANRRLADTFRVAATVSDAPGELRASWRFSPRHTVDAVYNTRDQEFRTTFRVAPP